MMLNLIDLDNPSSTYLTKALDSIKNKQFDNAIINFNKALIVNPNHLKIYMIASKYCYHQKKYNLAIQFLKRALDVDFYFSPAYSKIAQILQKQGHPEQAIIYLQNAIDFNPNNISLMTRLADLMLKLEKYQEAIYHYQKVINHNQSYLSANIYNKMGCAYRSLNKLDEALKSLTKSINIMKTPLFFVNRAIVFLKMNEQQNCVVDLNHSLQILKTKSNPQQQLFIINIMEQMNNKDLQQLIIMFKELIQTLIGIKLKKKNSQLFLKVLEIQKQIEKAFLKLIEYTQQKKSDQKKGMQKQIFNNFIAKLEGFNK